MTVLVAPTRPLRTRVEHVMGTAFSVTVEATLPAGVVDDAFAWLRWVDLTFSTYRPDSEISRIDAGDLTVDRASPEVRQVLARCGELTDLTDGWFTAVGAAGLDPSGLVKGWSIDVAAMILRMGGAQTFSVNGGGDIVCGGSPGEPGRGWRTGVRHPHRVDAVATVLELCDQAIATSGTYERGAHIWGTGGGGIAREQLRSVSVVGPELGTADALATAVFAEGSGRPAWLARFPRYELVLVTADDRLLTTPGVDRLRVA